MVDGEEKRKALGYYSGTKALMNHPYFKEFDWEEVKQKKLKTIWFKPNKLIQEYIESHKVKDAMPLEK